MNQQELITKLALSNWDSNVKRTTDLFNSLSDEQLSKEIAPGKNSVNYLLGHLTAVHDGMLPLLGLGERKYTQLDEAYLEAPDKKDAGTTSAKELRDAWADTSQSLSDHFKSLAPEDWFQKHTKISEEDFAKEPHRNRLSVLMSRSNHLSYHLGQLILAKPE